jgi:hypothetical protein
MRRRIAFNKPELTPSREDEECRRNIQQLASVPNVTAAYINDLRAAQPPSAEPFEIVLVCNVLHEIHPTGWPRLFEDLHSCVAKNGVVLVMEDQEMHVGELPNTDGFLVLDLFQMRMLFSASAEEMPEIRHEHAERLSVIELRRDVLARHANLRLRETCDAVKKVSLDGIAKLRGGAKSDWRTGRRHAYLAMLAVNAQLCADRLGS